MHGMNYCTHILLSSLERHQFLFPPTVFFSSCYLRVMYKVCYGFSSLRRSRLEIAEINFVITI
jgi:hypothetical protein